MTAPQSNVSLADDSAGASRPRTASRTDQRKEADAEVYATKLSARVKSFETAPLHSCAYLGYLAKYLRRPFQQSQKNQNLPQYRPEKRIFVNRYSIRPHQLPIVSSFNDPKDFAASGIPATNEIVFLRGRPSAQWLNEVGGAYGLDHRFFHNHLAPTVANHVHWYAFPALPSRAAGILKFRIPTIVQIGAPGRDLDVEMLEYARHKCHEHLRKMFRSMQDYTAEPGQSIIRAVNIHNGSTLVMEQEMTATAVRRGEKWSVIVWTDAGVEDDTDHVPVPMTDGFSAVAKQLAFCPAFFENDLVESQMYPQAPGKPGRQTCRQPMVLLGSQYGSTIDWSLSESMTPISVVQELLNFEACALLQYLNMLQILPAELTQRTQFPSYEHTKLETILHFDYMKDVLSPWKSHLSSLTAFVKDAPDPWHWSRTDVRPQTQCQGLLDVTKDFAYLVERVESLIGVCDDGKATLMSNSSVQDAKRSAQEASLVTSLTKATNRLTFIFLPISFLTSVFGMNFSEFGQGPLSVWIWAAIAFPMLIISILLVETGSSIKHWFQRRRQKSEHRS